MWTFSLDRYAEAPLHDQLANQLRDRIRSGFIPGGTRLPASRRLARVTKVGRNTVLSAYDILLTEGHLSARVGRGTFVRRVATSGSEPQRGSGPGVTVSLLNWEPLVARAPEPAPLTPGEPTDGDTIRLDSLIPDPSTFPIDEIRRLFQEIFKREGSAALNYGPAEGHGPLREAVALRVTEQGGRARPEDVLVVAGSQLGLDLVARLLIEPGDTVLVGAPTYANVLRIWQLYGARVVGVPIDEHGVRPDALDAVLERTRPKLLYLMPTFQNPTGASMDEGRCREVVTLAARHGVPVLEDHFDSELRYWGRPTPPLRAFDQRDQVMLLGTFSKMLFPGFRLGWLVSPQPAHQRLLNIRRTCELSPSMLPQMVAAEFCKRGLLDKHLDLVRPELSSRLEALLEAADRFLPQDVSTTRPEGGMTVWVTMPERGNATELLEACSKRGVLFAPGNWFHADGSGARNLRLTFGSEPAERIVEGMRRLGTTMKQHLRRSRSPTRRPAETAPFL